MSGENSKSALIGGKTAQAWETSIRYGGETQIRALAEAVKHDIRQKQPKNSDILEIARDIVAVTLHPDEPRHAEVVTAVFQRIKRLVDGEGRS
jgi:hypothetical protein